MGRFARRVLILGLLALVPICACRKGAVAPVTAPEPPPSPAAHPPPPPKTIVPEEGGEGIFALEEPFTGLAATKLATSSDRILRGLAFRGLTRLDPSGKVEPELAVRWETLRGGAEWVFHLRPDTPFANGRYVEARHVVSSWEKLIADPTARYAWLLESLKGFGETRPGGSQHVSGLLLEDGLTLRVVLTRPVRDLLFRLAHPALGISAFGEDEQGVGPFEIWGAPQPQQVVVRGNPEYFRGLPHMDEIAFVRGEAARPGRIAPGSLDGAILAAGEDAPSSASVRVFTHSIPRTYVLGLNRSTAPFSRPETARAFLASLDRDALRRAAAGEGGSIPSTLVAALAPGRKAAELPEKPPAPPASMGRLDLLIPDSDKAAGLLAGKIQAEVLRAGGRMMLHPVKSADLPAALARREYHLFILPFVPSTPHLLLSYQELMQWNRSIPGSLMAQARALEGEEDPAALPAALEPLDASLQLGGYLFPLVSLERRLLTRRGICGLRPDPVGTLDWTQVWESRTPGGECE
jgi:MarR-like DNA-binding transcriptional regulator SgrR of sgrS sRNA